MTVIMNNNSLPIQIKYTKLDLMEYLGSDRGTLEQQTVLKCAFT